MDLSLLRKIRAKCFSLLTYVLRTRSVALLRIISELLHLLLARLVLGVDIDGLYLGVLLARLGYLCVLVLNP